MLNKITTPAPAGGMTGSPTRRATDIAQHTARGVLTTVSAVPNRISHLRMRGLSSGKAFCLRYHAVFFFSSLNQNFTQRPKRFDILLGSRPDLFDAFPPALHRG